jgi:hypothetical protein
MQNVGQAKPVQSKPPVVFDNSAINGLADDPQRGLLQPRIGAGFCFRLTGDTFGEVVATTDAARRRFLLDLCKHLVTTGDCLLPHDELLKNVIKEHSKGDSYDWRAVGVRCKEYEDEIARQEFIDDHVAAEQRSFSAEVGSEFAQIYERARPHFQKLFRRHGAPPPSLSELIDALQAPGGAFWSMASELYSKPTGVNIREAAARDFVDACPPFRALLTALCIAQHQRSVQNPRRKSTGAFDLYASVYLPYCEEFVTADPIQQQALLQVACLAKLTAKVRSYADFRAALLLREWRLMAR